MKRFFILCWGLLGWGCVDAQDCRLVLTGHIEDADTKEKLAGAVVVIEELQAEFITDYNGDFRYPGVCPGTYQISVSHVGCETVSRQVTVSGNRHLDILLPHTRNNLEEVIVRGVRGIRSTGFQEQVSAGALEASRTASISEALATINGVTLLQTGSTITKPVIHGLHGQRILTINNGIRQEGQQWGNEHAPEIDAYVAGNLSVVKGADALRYGSDAIGGVVLIEPRPVRSLPGFGGEINTAYSTNNGQYIASGIFEHQPVKWPSFGYRVQGTYKASGNVRTPGYRLNNTGTREVNYSLAGAWRKDHFQLKAFYSEFNTTIGIFPGAHIGNLTDLLNRIPEDRPNAVYLGRKGSDIGRPRQEVLHRLLKIQSAFQKNEHHFNFTFGSQYNHRSEYDIVRNPANTRPQVRMAVITFSEELTYEHPTFANISGTLGLSAMQQDNSYSGRYLIPNYQSHTESAYLIEKWKKNKWQVEGGFRVDRKSVETQRLRFNGTNTDYSFDFDTYGSSLNIAYNPNSKTKLFLNGSRTSRAPHVNELLIDGVHEGTGTYEQGDISLRTEKSLSISAGADWNMVKDKINAGVYLYYQHIDDFIYQQPIPEQPVLTIVGAFPLIQYRQTDASLKGMDFSIHYQATPRLQLLSRYSLLRARNRVTDDWLILMPSDRWRNEVKYRFGKEDPLYENSVSLELLQVFAPRVPSNEPVKQDYREPPGAYSLVNLHASTGISLPGRIPAVLGLSVRNLLNTVYRDYLNSFRYYTDEMGRNITIRLKIPFENKKNR